MKNRAPCHGQFNLQTTILLTVCVSALVCSFPLTPSFAQTSSDALTQARALSEAAQFAEAAEAYRKILASDPQSYEATLELAETYLRIDNWKAAEEYAGKAELLRSTNPAPAVVRGNARARAGDPREAGFRYLRALSLDQKNADALVGLASLRWQRRETDGALTYLREAISLNHNFPEACYWLGKVFEDQNQLALAADAYKSYLSFKVAGSPDEGRSALLQELLPLFESFGSATAMQLSGPRSATVKLDLRNGAPVVQASLANGEQLNLLLDTAAKFPLTLDSAVAKRLNLETPFDGSIDFVMQRTHCRLGKLSQLRIGKLEIRDIPIAVADFSLLREGIGSGIDGTLGIAWLRHVEITIDYGTCTVGIGLPTLASMTESVDGPAVTGAHPKFSITVPLHSIDHRLVFFAEVKDKNAAMLLNTSSLASYVSADVLKSQLGATSARVRGDGRKIILQSFSGRNAFTGDLLGRAAGQSQQPPELLFQFDLAGGAFPLAGVKRSEDLDRVVSKDLSFQISVALGNSFLARLQRLTINLAAMSVRLDIDLSGAEKK